MAEKRDKIQGPARTEEIRAFLFKYMKNSSGRAPTTREIAEGVQPGPRSGLPMAPSVVKYHLKRLVKKGIIRRVTAEDGTLMARGIKIVGAVFLLPHEAAFVRALEQQAEDLQDLRPLNTVLSAAERAEERAAENAEVNSARRRAERLEMEAEK